MLHTEEGSFRIEFNRGTKRCTIYENDADIIVARGQYLNTKKRIRFVFADNQFVTLEKRKEKKKGYVIEKNGVNLMELHHGNMQSASIHWKNILFQSVFIFRNMIIEDNENEDDFFYYVIILGNC